MSTESPSRPSEAVEPSEPTAGQPGDRPASAWTLSRVLHLAERYALAFLLVAVVVYFSASRIGTNYTNPDNIRNIITSQGVLAVIALGSIVPLICGQFDLSVGAVAGMTSMLTATAYTSWHLPVLAGAAVGVAAGILVGVVNGFLVTVFEVNALITTLGTASVVTGVVNWYSGGNSIVQGIPESLTAIGTGTFLGLPRMLYVLIVVAVLVWYLLEHTPFGRYLHSVGTNPAAAQLVGLRIPSLVRRSFVVSGAAAGLAGVLQLAYNGTANPSVGNTFTLTALAAAFLGATSIRPGRFNVVGTLLAIYFLATAITGLTFLGVPDFINDLFTGGALVLAVAISSVLRRRRALT